MALRSLVDRLKRRAIGAPEKLPRRVLVVGFVTMLAIAIAGAFLAFQTGLESASTSSTGYLRPLLELTTNTWTYVLLLAVIFRGVLLFRDQRYAQQAAEITGIRSRSVRRLSEEVKEPDGTTRVIATSDESREAISERILAALDGADDDRMQLNPDLFEDAGPEDALLEHGELSPALDVRDEQLLSVLEALEDRAEDLNGELDQGTTDLLTMQFDEEAIADAIRSGQDRVGAAELLGESGDDLLEEQNERLEEAEANLDLQEEILEELEATGERRQVGAKSGGSARAEESPAPSTRRGRAWFALKDFFSPEREESDTSDHDEDLESHRDPWLEQWKLAKLDLASSLNFERVLWQFVVPAVVTIVSLLIVAQFWIRPYLYPPLFAMGVLVGLLYYWRASRKRSKRLEALRGEEETVQWDDAAILVKEVDVPEARLQMAWLAGTTYVHDDREAFADEIAHRAYELVNGLDPSPSVLEKQARQIAGKKPDLHGFRDQERKLIMERLLERVENAQDGLVPKAMLIEEVVEWDIEPRMFAPGKRGVGHDPDLVREAYRQLVPAALVEQDVPVEEGADETVTAVRHRRDPIPPEFGAIRARFSSQFSNYADWEPLYELPDVSDRLEEEPVFADTVGYRGEGS